MKDSNISRSRKSKVTGNRAGRKKSGRRRRTRGWTDGGLLSPEQQALLETLYTEHSRWMLPKAAGKGIREPDIVVTDALIRVAVKYDPRLGSLPGLLRKVFTDYLNGAYRAQARGASRTLPLPSDYHETPDERVAEQQRLRDLAEELALARRALPLEDQLLIKLVYEEGLTLDEIADLG